jgi:hydrogenase maturation protease
MTESSVRTLVAGVGNIFFGDDGFGVEVAKRLAECELPAGVTVADYGISGMHLAYDLSNGYERAILIDAAPRGGTPGTVYVMEPTEPAEASPAEVSTALFDAHGMQPDVVLGMLGMLGGKTGRLLIVGCEPQDAGPGIGLSAPVAAAVDDAVRTVLELVEGVTQEAS